MNFPVDMCIDIALNVECGNCPCGELCYNVYKYDLLCFDHPALDNEDPNGELSVLFRNLNLNKVE